ncbi:MAG TPA: S8 family serine peptidase [Candidatus Angelobacter sp.]|nr:S8 family serine peptidase [Candidatus Angelobacter sp.]
MSDVTRIRTLTSLVLIVLIAVAGTGSASGAHPPSPTEATEYARQWNLRAIHAETAWSEGEIGTPGVSVAVLDTGIDTEHPDLQGLVDLERSTSLLTMSTRCPAGEPGIPSGTAEDATARSLGLPLVTDFHSHGTAVSGLISSNAVVLAGVTQRTKLFGVKVHDRARRNCISVYLEGVRYAADNGADVIHLSFPLEFTRAQFPATFDDMVARVDATMDYAHRKGAVLVAAAGNASQEVGADSDVFRFCVARHVVCVSATGPGDPANVSPPAWDDPADYTNFGPAIDVAGPGGTGTFPNQVVPVWLHCSRVNLVATGAPAQCGTAPRLIWASTGTSFGAAATSGLIALLVDRIGKNRPDEVVAELIASADDLGPAGRDPYYGEGRISVANAVRAASP